MIGLLLNALKAAGKDVLTGVENNLRGGRPQAPQEQPMAPPPAAQPLQPLQPIQNVMDPATAPPRTTLPQMTALPAPAVQPPPAGAVDPNKRRLGAMDVY